MKNYITFNSDFRDSVNLYLDLNKTEKINSYIPTKSSVEIMKEYVDTILFKRNQATLLIGPYGKGKSHLLLLLLAIISLERTSKNDRLVEGLVKRIENVDEQVAGEIRKIWSSKGRYLPVLIMSTQGNLNQAFLVGLNEALKRNGLDELTPETYYSYAMTTINRWKSDYPDTYNKYCELVIQRNLTPKKLYAGLSNCESEMLGVFKEIYPMLTAGSVFNPLVNAEVLPMYKNIADKLKEEYGYSGIYIVFDEFSKYIEAQDKSKTGHNMKLIQDMCELANNSKSAEILMTMVAHKSIKEYGKNLSIETINSFTGIEGRIKEIFFVTSSKNNYELIQNAIFKKQGFEENNKIAPFLNEDSRVDFYNIVAFRSSFTVDDFREIVLKGCYPLSPTTAFLLLNISEKVAQNERTLFTFISKDEQYSVKRYVDSLLDNSNQAWIVNADSVYDYFKSMFKRDVNNELVHHEWLNAEYALKQVSNHDEKVMIKTLAVINIVNKTEELCADDKTLRLAAGVLDAGKTISELIDKGIIYKKGANNCYVFKTRATSALKTEIGKRRTIKGTRVNIGNVLAEVSEDKYVLPKKYNDKFSMTRYFRYEYMAAEDFLDLTDINILIEKEVLCDGKILVLFSTTGVNQINEIKEKILTSRCTNLVVIYNHKKIEIVEQVQEYEVLQDLKFDTNFFSLEENKVLEKELQISEDDLVQEITNYLNEAFGEVSEKNVFYYNQGILKNDNVIKLGQVVDKVCYSIYYNTLAINNEMINKEVISTAPIKKARRTIIETLLNGDDVKTYLNGTSAEATIYRAVFVRTGIYNNNYTQNADIVMNSINQFISQACDDRVRLSMLMDVLTGRPISLRRGVIPLLLAYAISQRNEDIIVCFGKKEIEINADIILNMCETPKDYYIIVSAEDIKKEQYLSELMVAFNVESIEKKRDSRLSNILSCMQRWFRSLPQVTKNINAKNGYLTNRLVIEGYPKVKRILQSAEANPYEAIFKQIPEAFCSSELVDAAKCLIEMKNSLNGYYAWITEKVISESIFVFDKKRTQSLRHTLNEWYEKQSNLAKHGLHEGQITSFMTAIAENTSFDDAEIIKKVVRAVTEIHLDTWNDSSIELYISKLKVIKHEIEKIEEVSDELGKLELSFVGKSGEAIVRYYERTNEGTGVVLRNIMEDTLDDFSDMPVNDKVAILLEMIEKVLE